MKLLVNQLVARANQSIDRQANEAKMPENFRRIQDAFKNNALLSGQESLAELCGLITGFRPRTSSCKVAPFEVFALMSKAEQRVTKFALCMVSVNGSVFGCTGLNEAYLQYAPDTCRLATAEEATKFITEEVSTWEDVAVLNWINSKLGANYYQLFFGELDRQIPTAASK